MKNIKKIFLLLAIVMVIIPITNTFASPLEGYKQVANLGGCNSNSNDGVTVCKTISESNLENYFDITLSVETTSKIEEITKAQDLAVVLVMDISNTMNYGLTSETTTGDTRLSVAKSSAIDFINKFYDYSKNSNAVRQIGLVTFNKDSNDVFKGLQNVKTQSNVDDLNNKINKITAPSGVDIKWTNMESGLKRAKNLLASSSVKNKYIIFLTDGLPTTYIKSGYEGYIPLKSDHTKYSEHRVGNFYNYEIDVPIGDKDWSGTNYSDLGARRAEELALNIKNSGIKIYSIGVGITGQYTLYHLQYNDKGSHANTVDTDTEERNYIYYSNNGYKIPRYYSVLPGVDVPSKNATTNSSVKAKYDDTSYYKTWLSEYIGSDNLGTNEKKRKYYYDSDNKEALENAYKQIFEDIKEMTSQEINASWVAEDPMNASGQTSNIQFVGLYDDNMNLKDKLNIANDGESDTASYNEDKDTISWNLKNSTRTEIKKQENGKEVTYYKYEVKYRIRLENELSDFIKDKNYATNGKTYLDYVIIENINGVNVRTDLKTIDFPIPEVNGYLGELTFNKISNYGNMPLNGITFRLVHDSNCPCTAERKHIDENYHMESISNNGVVAFNNIPSGHSYKLYEVSSDGLHEVDKTEYEVNVSYGVTTTNIQNNTIINKHIRKNLSIEKLVQGIETNKEFTFELTATYNGSSLVGKYNIEKNGVTSEIEFIDGKITFTLKSNEKIIIKDLPLSINYNVKELDTDGFVVKYQVNNGEIKIYDENNLEIINLNDNSNILFINASGYELPETGSSSTLILIIIGYLLLIGPIIYIGYDIYKKKGKADFLSK